MSLVIDKSKRKKIERQHNTLAVQPGLVISVKEARKLLGKQYEHLTDEEVERTVALLENIARKYIQSTVPQY